MVYCTVQYLYHSTDTYPVPVSYSASQDAPAYIACLRHQYVWTRGSWKPSNNAFEAQWDVQVGVDLSMMCGEQLSARVVCD